MNALVVHSPRYACDIGPHVFPTAKYGLVRDRLVAEGWVAARRDLRSAARAARAAASWRTRRRTSTISTRCASRRAPRTPSCRSRPRSSRPTGARPRARGGGARRAHASRGGALERRISSRLGRSRRGLLLHQRHRGRDPRASEERRDPPRRGGGPGRAPGQRHGADLRARPERVHALAAPGVELSGPEGHAARSTWGWTTASATTRTTANWWRRSSSVWAFAPELVVYAAGADPYVDDQLGGLALTLDGLERRDRRVLEGCASRRIPVVVTLGGRLRAPARGHGARSTPPPAASRLRSRG